MKTRIQDLRKELGVTQSELADAVDVTRQTIISLEGGRYKASLVLAHKLAQFFHVTIEELFIKHMKGFCLFSGSKVTNNEEFRKQLQAKNKCLLGLILLGIISAAAAYYMEFWGKMKVDDYMLGVYCGIGVGLICSGIVFLIRNKRLMKDEEKLKEARLQVTDERNIEIGSRALRMAAFVLLIVMYFAFLFGGLYDPMISKLMSCMICLFLIVYAIAWRVLNKHM